MNAFFEKGVQLQQNSWTLEWAEMAFARSCAMCAMRGMAVTCDRCPIAAAHEVTVFIFKAQTEVKVIENKQ